MEIWVTWLATLWIQDISSLSAQKLVQQMFNSFFKSSLQKKILTLWNCLHDQIDSTDKGNNNRIRHQGDSRVAKQMFVYWSIVCSFLQIKKIRFFPKNWNDLEKGNGIQECTYSASNYFHLNIYVISLNLTPRLRLQLKIQIKVFMFIY